MIDPGGRRFEEQAQDNLGLLVLSSQHALVGLHPHQQTFLPFLTSFNVILMRWSAKYNK